MKTFSPEWAQKMAQKEQDSDWTPLIGAPDEPVHIATAIAGKQVLSSTLCAAFVKNGGKNIMPLDIGKDNQKISPHFYNCRTVEWGHWAITFMNPQPDPSKNFGEIVGHLSFPVGNGCGPQDGALGSPTREQYKEICRNWIENGILPEDLPLYRAYTG